MGASSRGVAKTAFDLVIYPENIMFLLLKIFTFYIFKRVLWYVSPKIFFFQDMDGFKGMGFVIKKILVHSEPTRVRGGEAHYNMVREKWDVRNLLEVII